MPAAPTTPTPAADVPRTPSSAPLAAKDGPAFNVETIDVVPTPTCAASTRTGSPAAALTALGPARREATSAPSPPSAAPRIARRERGAEESADIGGPPSDAKSAGKGLDGEQYRRPRRVRPHVFAVGRKQVFERSSQPEICCNSHTRTLTARFVGPETGGRPDHGIGVRG